MTEAASSAMDATALALRARRLQRLRVGGGGTGAPATPDALTAARPGLGGASADRRRRRATALAEAVAGRVVIGLAGSIVEVVRSGSLPLPRAALTRLPDRLPPEDPLVCLDTETTGLGTAAGTVPFLCGLGVWEGDRFTVRQLLLPDHADEPALLERLTSLVPAAAWLVTYNGRSFDWPLLETRFRLHGAGPPVHAGHLDLLPLARQMWRHRLLDARLATVERGVAGVFRTDDLPGALIPERYFRFLRGEDPRLLEAVVRHNRQDVASLARLLRVLADALGDVSGHGGMPAGDLWGLSRAYTRRRRYDEALACLDAAAAGPAAAGPAAARAVTRPAGDPWLTSIPERVAMDRARVLRRLGRRDESLVAWQILAEGGGCLSGLAWVQVAIHLEHHARDPHAALDAALRAERTASRAAALGMPLPYVERDLARRLPRLRRLILRPGMRRPAA